MPPHRLLLVRHAEAAGGPVDAERTLTPRGERHAAAIGSWLAGAGLVPDRVVLSPARRTVQTWERARAALERAAGPVVDARVYGATVEDLLGVVRETAEDVATLVVVGHNPSVGELAGLLDDGRGDLALRREVQGGFRPGQVAVFTVGTAFAELVPGTATLEDVAVPGD
ncbi:histidine phosphatase family protein [Geodermatophilus sp. DSM 44513]|uniref:SixA phosphatase family protein n=1 Tax=Geodermatophilus sp. DSM 44513 TaxID=1528104 RepID=UPI0012719DB2|nr:histidine phosphatase family protein [Geodermatophilus sp. DSM 44513]WNV76541.1 histidine phosphatase family protein [Geodermatophilus sp. DSM 44513]